MAEPQPDKASWPELVGKTGDEAAAVIRAERPDLRVQVLAFGSMATADFRTDRVRINLDEGGKVARPPQIG